MRASVYAGVQLARFASHCLDCHARDAIAGSLKAIGQILDYAPVSTVNFALSFYQNYFTINVNGSRPDLPVRSDYFALYIPRDKMVPSESSVFPLARAWVLPIPASTIKIREFTAV